MIEENGRRRHAAPTPSKLGPNPTQKKNNAKKTPARKNIVTHFLIFFKCYQ
jgi:hypothetical protein